MFQDIFTFLTSGSPAEGCNIIKKRHDHLDQQGDACFPLDISVWRRYLEESEKDDHLTWDDQELIRSSQDWPSPIQRVVRDTANCRIFFDRTECLRKYFERRRERELPEVSLDPIPADLDINSYRQRIARESLDRLLTLWKMQQDILIDDSSLEGAKIGSCFDSSTKRPFPLSYQDYLSKRSTDMQLIAQHKYGLRVQNEKYLRDLVGTLGSAAVVVDLLEAKTSGPVFLASKPNLMANTSSKGAAFILYNSARIETLFRVYGERLQSGEYSPAPEHPDWSLLREEDEWKLFYNFLVEYDQVLERTVRGFTHGKEIQVHNICNFLYKLVGQFSVYYRRTKILVVSWTGVLV